MTETTAKPDFSSQNEVMTLPEAATYLRLREDEVRDLAERDRTSVV
jgi:hypothetical protein